MARRGGDQGPRRPARDADIGTERWGTERWGAESSAGEQSTPRPRPTKPPQSLDRLDLTNMEVIQTARCHLSRAIGLLK